MIKVDGCVLCESKRRRKQVSHEGVHYIAYGAGYLVSLVGAGCEEDKRAHGT